MMRMLAAGAALFSACSFAGDFYAGPAWGKNCPGQKVRVDQYNIFLSTTAKCDIPVVNAEHMKAMYMKYPKIEFYGCWGKLLNGNFILLHRDGKTETYPQEVFALVRASKNDDGVVLSSAAHDRGLSKCPQP